MNSEPLVLQKRPPEKPKTITIRIEQDLLSRIDNTVLETGRSRNELINLMLRYAIKNAVVEEEE